MSSRRASGARAALKAAWAGGTALAALAAASPAAAQDSDAVGPPQLRDFRLDAPATRPQPRPPQDEPVIAPARPEPVQQAPAPAPAPRQAEPQASPPPRPAPAETAPPRAAAPQPQPRAAEPAERGAPPPLPDVAPPPLPDAPPPPLFDSAPVPVDPAPALPAEPAPPAAVPDASGSGLAWLFYPLGAGLLGLVAWLAFRRRRRTEFAEAVPAPPPVPAPEPRPEPVATVSIPEPRPWLELDFAPQRAAATDKQTEVQFELVVRNDGKVDARNVRIEARMFNAAAENEIEAFFRMGPSQAGQGLSIPPGMEARANSRVMMPLEAVRPIRVQERSLFVPLVAFNVFYEWADGRIGQTSRTWLVGREAQPPAEKMGAFRLDLGPRIYRQVGRRQHALARVV
ncbi:MAG: hypothetical protein ACK4K7_06560 [Allosphingosinicella sp.]|uniref:hypothetical protein n=1 Tax=Allosphingosinicella sp. TaxID=2823234 RepID=UPI0039364B7E